ncbi:MAG: rRNA maturation RNase YbeY [Nitrospirota bacterium]
MNISLRNRQRLIKVNPRRVRSLLRRAFLRLGLHKAELSVLFVNDSRMRILNRTYRGIDRTTDVLSFPQTESRSQKSEVGSRNTEPGTQNVVLGDVVVNLHKAKIQAEEYGHSFYEELDRLLIHGLLHLIGYDHEKGGSAEGRMKRKERELLRSSNPL